MAECHIKTGSETPRLEKVGRQTKEDTSANYYQWGDYQLKIAEEEEKVVVLNDCQMTVKHRGFFDVEKSLFLKYLKKWRHPPSHSLMFRSY